MWLGALYYFLRRINASICPLSAPISRPTSSLVERPLPMAGASEQELPCQFCSRYHLSRRLDSMRPRQWQQQRQILKLQ
ncbi:hypothetical protein BDR03DRAFT_960178 [Suillus americanus]|nr:hypothetical protein BDR03DRAFT_960178 [Suillus americanus]